VPLRRIARETGSSYARIAQCQKRILDHVRARLAADAETRHLQAAAAHSPEGMDTPIDHRLNTELEQIRIDDFIARFNAAAPGRRGSVLLELLKAADTPAEAVVRSLAGSIPPERRARFLAYSA
jgi:hypothetical protein